MKRGLFIASLIANVLLLAAALHLDVEVESALDTAGSLQVRFIECEGDRLNLQVSLQSCDTGFRAISLGRRR